MQTQTVKRADARRNRGLILDAAKTAFARDGIDASLDEVARSAGVGPGTLYRHFPTREHLLCELLYERQAALLSRRDEAAALACAKVALQCWMAALKDYLNAFNGLPRSFINAFEAQASPLAVTCRILISVTEEFLSRAQAEGAARSSVSAPALFLSALGAAFVHDKVSDYGTTPERVEEILALGYLVDGSAVNTRDASGSNTPLEHPMTQLSVGDQRHGRRHPGDQRRWPCATGAIVDPGANGEASELAPLTPPPSAYEGWPKDAIARNVARLYALVAQDTASGSRSAPNFRDALALHETLDAIERSATGSNPK